MVEKFQNSKKASVLQILKSASLAYNKATLPMEYKVVEQNPMDDTFSLEITPDNTASQVFPHLARFKSIGVNSVAPTSTEDDAIKEVIKEVLIKHIFDVKNK